MLRRSENYIYAYDQLVWQSKGERQEKRNFQGREKEEKYRKAIRILPNQKLLAAKMRITAKGDRSSVRIDLSWFM